MTTDKTRGRIRHSARGAIMLLGMMLILFAGTKAQDSAKPDSLLALVQTLYDNGSFLSAELEARRLLDDPVLGDSSRIVAEQYVAFSLIAQGKNAAAEEYFVSILRKDSTFTLDPLMTSPKIISVLQDAQQRYARQMRAEAPPVVKPVATTPEVGPSFRLMVFPGWDQLHQGRSTKGVVLLSAGALSLGSLVTFDILRRSARDEYMKALTPEQAADKYKDYNTYHKAEYYSAAAFVVVYVYSAFDAFFDLPPRLDARLTPEGSGMQLSVAIPF
jgi:hypothetical protein